VIIVHHPDRPAKAFHRNHLRAHSRAAALARELRRWPKVARWLVRQGRLGAPWSSSLRPRIQADHPASLLGCSTARADPIRGRGCCWSAGRWRDFRLIGIGTADLCPAVEADPPDLFGS
jgi:hypothetical protein